MINKTVLKILGVELSSTEYKICVKAKLPDGKYKFINLKDYDRLIEELQAFRESFMFNNPTDYDI